MIEEMKKDCEIIRTNLTTSQPYTYLLMTDLG